MKKVFCKRIWREPTKLVRIPRKLEGEFKKWLRGRGYGVLDNQPVTD